LVKLTEIEAISKMYKHMSREFYFWKPRAVYKHVEGLRQFLICPYRPRTEAHRLP